MPPKKSNTVIDAAFAALTAAYIDTLTSNAADALIAGDVAAMHTLKLPINFNLVSSHAVAATKDYRDTMIRYGGSIVTKVKDDGTTVREFEPWLKTSIDADKEQVANIISDAVKNGTPLPQVQKSLDQVFTNRENSSKLTAYQETKSLYTQGTMDRYADHGIERGIWHHMDPQPDPRIEHQEREGIVYDLTDPILNDLFDFNCHCWIEPITSVNASKEVIK